MGSVFGSIKEGVGFIPNDNFCAEEKTSVVEYGQHAVAYEAPKGVLAELRVFFNPLDATRVYLLALLFKVNGLTSLKNISVSFVRAVFLSGTPTVSLSHGILSALLDSLGRRDADHPPCALRHRHGQALARRAFCGEYGRQDQREGPVGPLCLHREAVHS
ncbi:MAG: hypothetical protein RBR15_10495 [Sphaerochaeta sp.]|nr:hypothetical protein [Sphaerochaeta sp.]